MRASHVVALTGAGFVGLLTLSIVGGSFFTVDQGERAVITRLGKVVGVAEPGFHTKTPFIQSAHTIEVRQLSTALEKVQSYSKDQQAADLELVLLWRADAARVADIYEHYGNLEGLARRELLSKSPSAAKVVFGRYNAVSAIQERGRLVSEIEESVRTAIGQAPLFLDSVQLTNIDFSDAYENAVEQRMMAEVEVQRRAQEAAQEIERAKATVTKARADADSGLARAKAEAEGELAKRRAESEGIKLMAEAQAQAIRQRGEALRDNPTLIDLTKAERWNGQLPTSMIPGNAVPFIDLQR